METDDWEIDKSECDSFTAFHFLAMSSVLWGSLSISWWLLALRAESSLSLAGGEWKKKDPSSPRLKTTSAGIAAELSSCLFYRSHPASALLRWANSQAARTLWQLTYWSTMLEVDSQTVLLGTTRRQKRVLASYERMTDAFFQTVRHIDQESCSCARACLQPGHRWVHKCV